MRREPAKARTFAETHGISVCTDDAAEVIRHPKVEIVYVATPPSSHREYVLAAAAAGKHVLVEKPMGMSAAEDRVMIAACEMAGVQFFVAYFRRFHPHVRRMKEWIDAGRIGQPVMAQVDYAQPPSARHDWGWRVQSKISGGGLFVDIVSHRIDLMVHLLGEPAAIRGVSKPASGDTAAEEVAALAVRFASGAPCSILGDSASSRRADRVLIAGTAGVMWCDPLDGHSLSLRTGDKMEEFNFPKFPAPHLGLIQHIERVLDGSEVNAVSGTDGLWTDFILDHGLRA